MDFTFLAALTNQILHAPTRSVFAIPSLGFIQAFDCTHYSLRNRASFVIEIHAISSKSGNHLNIDGILSTI